MGFFLSFFKLIPLKSESSFFSFLEEENLYEELETLEILPNVQFFFICIPRWNRPILGHFLVNTSSPFKHCGCSSSLPSTDFYSKVEKQSQIYLPLSIFWFNFVENMPYLLGFLFIPQFYHQNTEISFRPEMPVVLAGKVV